VARLASTVLKILNAIGLPDPVTASNPETRGFWGIDLNAVLVAFDNELALTYTGNPNGFLAGLFIGRRCWDSVNKTMWIVTTVGSTAATTVWEDMSVLAASRANFQEAVPVLPTVYLEAIPEEMPPTELDYSRASTGYRVNQFGLLELMPINQIRHQYDPETGEYLGWLLEKGSTNVFLYSQEMDNAYWTKINSTVTANAGTAPDGTVTADRITEDNTSGQRYCRRTSITVASSQSYNFSAFVKPDANRTGISLYLYNGSSEGTIVDFNLTTGSFNQTSVGTVTEMNATIEEYPEGWYRLSITCKCNTAGTAVSGAFYFSSDPNNGNASYAGDNTSGVLLWGMQMEVLNAPTSYIPTGAATATRSGEFMALSVSQFPWWNPREGTFYLERRIWKESAIAAWSAGLYLSDSNYVAFRAEANSTISARIACGGSTIFSLGIATAETGPATPRAQHKLAVAWDATTQNFAFNGSGIAGSSGVYVPFAAANMRLNRMRPSDTDSIQIIRRVAYYPRRLSGQQISSLTGR
jgi:hypothetical protein